MICRHNWAGLNPARRICFGVLLIFAAVLISGCTGKSEPTSFYILSPDEEVVADSIISSPVSILVGPVTVASYLDRSQVIARQSEVEIKLYDFDHWAEPLDKNLKRVLIAQLSSMLGSAEVYDFENSMSPATAYQVQVEVNRFDVTRDGTAVFVAFWSIVDDSGSILRRNKTVLTREAANRKISSTVAAQNQLINEFSRIVGREIVGLGKIPKG